MLKIKNREMQTRPMHPQRGVAELYAVESVFCALLSMMVLAYIWKKVKLVLDGSIHGLKRS